MLRRINATLIAYVLVLFPNCKTYLSWLALEVKRAMSIIPWATVFFAANTLYEDFFFFSELELWLSTGSFKVSFSCSSLATLPFGDGTSAITAAILQGEDKGFTKVVMEDRTQKFTFSLAKILTLKLKRLLLLKVCRLNFKTQSHKGCFKRSSASKLARRWFFRRKE